MLYKDKIKNLTAMYPELARVWIKTGDPRPPLKGVWINESRLHRVGRRGLRLGKPRKRNRRIRGGPLTCA